MYPSGDHLELCHMEDPYIVNYAFIRSKICCTAQRGITQSLKKRKWKSLEKKWDLRVRSWKSKNKEEKQSEGGVADVPCQQYSAAPRQLRTRPPLMKKKVGLPFVGGGGANKTMAETKKIKNIKFWHPPFVSVCSSYLPCQTTLSLGLGLGLCLQVTSIEEDCRCS